VSRFERRLLHLATLLVGGTGLIYVWMLYFVRPADPYAVVNHPWQPQVQHLHVLAAPLLVFGAGVIWRRHVWAQWQRRVPQGLKSGVALGLTLLPMIASGYLIQTATDDTWRKIWVGVHLTTSGLWLAGYVVHQAGRIRARRGLTASAPAPTGIRSPAALHSRSPEARGPRGAG
jgi:hypothetical protein